ncbi:MAG: TetR/AcrR family transcriptional regulator [Eubacteriales bacterium]|nr:TetR/AcrR family transcriptional regulator [Eubacteriales bacterium]
MKYDKIDIFTNARELFYSKGFKDTSVSDITKKTGIAVGSFYNFYKSKEDVFFDVFIAESDKLKKQIVSEVDLDRDPVVVVKEITLKIFEGTRKSPILREWFSRDAYSKLEKYLQDENGTEEFEEDYSYNLFTGIIKKWQVEGVFRSDIDSGMIMAILNTFQYIDMHKYDIGNQYFPQLLEYVIEFVVKGLCTEK